MLLEVIAFIAGVMLLKYSSSKTVDCSVVLAKALKVSPLIIGMVLVSIGTDLPEIANSLISSYLGHGDINVGDTFGSPLAQITLVFALIVILGGSIKVKRTDIIHLGIGTLLATLLAFVLVSDGFISRIDAVALLIGFMILLGALCRFNPGGVCLINIKKNFKNKSLDIFLFGKLALSIIGVIAGSVLVVNSIIAISEGMDLPEFIVSFFVLGLGTSLPEFMVDLAAIRKRQFGLALGDIFGSNMVDLTLALGIGPLFFPNILTPGLVNTSGLYLFVASLIVVGLLLWRKKLDRKAAIILLLLYIASYLVIPSL